MKLHGHLIVISIVGFVVLHLISGVSYGIDTPSRAKANFSAAAHRQEFTCGTYRGNETEALWHFCHYQSALKRRSSLPSSEVIFDDVVVIEDDGFVLTSGENPFDTDNRTFHFRPNNNSGYSVTEGTFDFDTDLGSNLSLGDDTNSTVNLAFQFSYFGTVWGEVHVNANGIVSFGADVNPGGFYSDTDFFNELAKIAVYFMDLNPEVGGGVFAKSSVDRLTITWNQVPEFDTSNSNTLQLVLFPDGSFDVTFNGVAATIATSGTPIACGVHPGGNPTLDIMSFSDDVPYEGGANAGFFENYFNISRPIVNETALLQRFYNTFPDSFFQIVFFSNFAQTMGGFANERNIKNLVQGIGLGEFDQSDLFGSAGVLESRLNMNQLAVWPNDPEQRFFSDGNNFLTVMGQETGHRWGAFINFIDSNGQRSNLILGRADAHWSFYFDSDHSSLEGGNWEETSPGTFAVPTQIDFFSEIDEYIMGLRTPEEVSPMFFISSPTNNQPQNRDNGTPIIGATASGTAVPVTIEDIIAAEGERTSTEPEESKDLRQAFILVTQNGNVPTQAELNKIATFRRAWEDYFEISVDGRFALNTSLTRTFPVAVVRGHVLDSITKLPIQEILVESSERAFSQFVVSGGRYTFRYMADENSGSGESVTINVSAPGYESGSLNTTIPYGTELVFDFELQALPTGVADPVAKPLSFTLHANFPNPFNPSTEIRYQLAKASQTALTIYNMRGQVVRTFLKDRQDAGAYAIQWDGRDEDGAEVASGLYLYRLTADGFSQTRKMLLLR